MASISVRRGLAADKTVHIFNGKLRDRLGLDWPRCKIFKGGEELSHCQQVKG
jgi:hypothetical protein